MEDVFSQRLSALRKERKISQKEAAMYFGISQALLSHYENGVRKCGIDFVIKSAEFYNVSTDYLLGLTNRKNHSSVEFDTDEFHPGDSKICYSTIRRATAALFDKYSDTGENTAPSDLSKICLSIYRTILYGVASGKIPSSWLNVSSSSRVRELIKIANTFNSSPSLSYDEKIVLLKSDTPAPPCIKTVVGEAQNIFSHLANQVIEKMSFD